jgi:hypothetical protein
MSNSFVQKDLDKVINDQMSAFEYHVLPSFLNFEQKYPNLFDDHVDLIHGALKLMRDYRNFRKALKLYHNSVLKLGVYLDHQREIEFQGEKTTFVTVRFAHPKDNCSDKMLNFSFRENGDQFDGHANYAKENPRFSIN